MRFGSVSLSGFGNEHLKTVPAKEIAGTACTLTTAQIAIQYEGQLQYGVIGIVKAARAEGLKEPKAERPEQTYLQK